MRVRKTTSVRHQLVKLMRDAISESQLAPGQLLVERELCEATGASRTSVREVLRQLESEGLVESELGRGTRVATMTREKSEEIYQVRGALESLASRLFTEHASAAQRNDLDLAITRMEAAADDPMKFLAAKRQIYEVLFIGAGNQVAYDISQTLYRQINFLRAASVSVPGRINESIVEVRTIQAAIERRDAASAEAAAYAHVSHAHDASLIAFDREWLTENTA